MTDAMGVLLIRRVRWWAEKRASRPRDVALNFSEDELTTAYRGIDGTPWPEELSTDVPHDSGLAAIEHWPAVFGVATEQTGESVYDAIIVAKPPGTTIDIPGVEFLGFDFGYYDDEFS